MSRAFICDHCERLYASYKGMVDLLDMDNIQCRKDNKLTIVPIAHCNECEEASWENESTPSLELGHYTDKEIYCEGTFGEECEYYNSGEQESYLSQLLNLRRY